MARKSRRTKKPKLPQAKPCELRGGTVSPSLLKRHTVRSVPGFAILTRELCAAKKQHTF